jgi:YD repeat-containing protein
LGRTPLKHNFREKRSPSELELCVTNRAHYFRRRSLPHHTARQYKVQTSYDFNTGKPTSFTGMNGNVTSYKYADELERLTEADFPDGGVTTFGYCDAGSNQPCPSGSPTNSVTKTVKQNSCSTGNAVVTDALYDGLGRTTKTHQYENPGAIVVQTLFDGMGRTHSVSNPMRKVIVANTPNHHLRDESCTTNGAPICVYLRLEVLKYEDFLRPVHQSQI